MDARPAVPIGQRPWEQTLEQIEDGELLVELDASMAAMVSELRQVFAAQGGKPKASLTLKITMQMEKGSVFVDADVTTKLPKRGKPITMLYPTKDNLLVRNDPKQGVLALDGEPRSAPALEVLPAYGGQR